MNLLFSWLNMRQGLTQAVVMAEDLIEVGSLTEFHWIISEDLATQQCNYENYDIYIFLSSTSSETQVSFLSAVFHNKRPGQWNS